MLILFAGQFLRKCLLSESDLSWEEIQNYLRIEPDFPA